MTFSRSNLLFVLCLAIGLIVALVVSYLASSSLQTTERQEITVATADWPPYIIESPDHQFRGQEKHGPLAMLVEEMFRLAGHRIKLQFNTWEASLDAVESGEVEAAFSYAPEGGVRGCKSGAAEENKEKCDLSGRRRLRTERFYFTESFFPFVHVLFYRRDKVDIAALANWVESENPEKRYHMGWIKGYALWPEILESSKKISTYPNVKEAFLALNSGEIDLLPESPHVGRAFLNNEGKDQGMRTDDFGRYWSSDGVMAGSTLPQHVLTARNREGLQLRNQLNAAIAALAKQGKLAELRSRFERLDHPWGVRTHVTIGAITTAREFCEDGEDCKEYLLAKGTSAFALVWPPMFSETVSLGDRLDDAESQECLVKVRSGPHANRLLYVPIKALELNAMSE